MKALHSIVRLARLLCVTSCLLLAGPAQAALDIIDAVDITHGRGESTLHIRLNVPVSYKTHAPAHSGDLLRIFVEPAPTLGNAGDALLGEQSIQWSPDGQVPLSDVTYEGGGVGNTSITLRFRHVVEFSVPRAADFRTLDIIIKHAGGDTAAIPHGSTGSPAAQPRASSGDETSRPRARRGDAPALPAAGMPGSAATVMHPPQAAAVPPFPYVVNLASSPAPFQADDMPGPELFMELQGLGASQAYRLYTTTFDKDGRQWYRLRLGFFRTLEHAKIVRKDLKSHYPDAWVARASVAERIRSSETMLAGNLSGTTGVAAEAVQADPGPAAPFAPASGAAAASIPPQRLAALMQEARGKMTDQDYAGAIRLYTRVLQQPENDYSRDALEYLGLARERNGQLAHAKMLYRDYLQRYPEGEGSERVRQRLSAVLTARMQPKEKLRAAGDSTQEQEPAQWDVFGGVSQYYRRDENTTTIDEDNEVTTLTQSSLDSNVDVTARRRGSDLDLRTRFTGGYLHDFLDDGENSETTVSSLYIDASAVHHDVSMRLGRQSRSTGGVLGRFDGLLLGLPLGDSVSVAAVGGFPVESSSDSFDDTDRYFYGLTLETPGFARGWDANAFIIEQQVDGVTDRRAVGGELRYFDPTRSLFTLVDYDIYFNELNIAQLLGNWTFADRTTVNLVADYRNSPLLTTSNALIGQAADSIEGLQGGFTDSEIEALARDRTASSRLATLGVSHPATERLQVSADVTALNLSDTDASGGVAATEGTGTDLIYNLQLIGSDLVTQGDISILGLRYNDAGDRDIYSLTFNTRYPVSRDFRVNPRLRVDYRKDLDNDTNQIAYLPSLRLDYRLKRHLRLEAEIGGEYSNRELVDGTEERNSYFINMGYRADF